MSTPSADRGKRNQQGLALVMAMMLLALLMTMLLGYFTLTRISLATTGSTMDSLDGLYVAEAGLNVRADVVRQLFQGYNRPSGTSPDEALPPCVGTNQGSGDLACVDYDLNGKTATTYLREHPGNPEVIVVPRGELYQNLSAQEYTYTVDSVSRNAEGDTHAVLGLQFKSRLVPMFQFAAFYNKDLEILPGPAMLLEGPVHVNGDLYIGANNSLDVEGQVTSSGDVYRGRKNVDLCMPGAVTVADPEVQTELPPCTLTRRLYTQSELDAWNGMVRTRVDPVSVPPPETLDPVPGEPYWDRAEIRIMLDLTGASPSIRVMNVDGTLNAVDAATLAGCGAASFSDTLYNHREGSAVDMLDIDVVQLLNCLHTTSLLGGGKDIDETSEGGLVWYLGVIGPDADTINNYGVRLRNGAELASTEASAPSIRGLTVVTHQAVYLEGDYNAVNKKPAAVLADSINILSNAWLDANSSGPLDARIASDTTIQAAFLAGTDLTGGSDGAAGRDLGHYNGGLENYPRFHEKWGGHTLTYRGSFVSLNPPRHVSGLWENQSYQAPARNWFYDTDFDDAAKLPPMTPRFVYLRQQLFLREFEL
jgi:hypothetical protein